MVIVSLLGSVFKHNYFFQFLNQLPVTGTKGCEFFVWVEKSLHVDSVSTDSDFWKESVLPRWPLVIFLF